MKIVTVGTQAKFTKRGAYAGQQAIVRLRGRTIADVFPPGTRLRVVRQAQQGKTVIVLEEATIGSQSTRF